MRRTARAWTTFGIGLLATGCAGNAGPSPSAPPGGAIASMTVTSSALGRGNQIAIESTCDGKNVAPALTWSAPPEGTKSLAVVVDDPDAPSAVFTHWIVIDLPPETLSLAAGVDPTTLGAKVGMNGFHDVGYGGPCPPHGESHRYQFQVYAADRVLGLPDGATRASVDAALSGHTLGFGMAIGSFGH